MSERLGPAPMVPPPVVDLTLNVPEISDYVNHPTHYTSGNIECIDAIQAALTPEEFRGFLKGQVFKYYWRAGKKDVMQTKQDIEKAQWYANKLLTTL